MRQQQRRLNITKTKNPKKSGGGGIFSFKRTLWSDAEKAVEAVA